MGGNCVTYGGNVSTKMADLTTVKIMLNSILSTPNGKFMTGNIKDFYLNTPMDEYKYMRIPVTIIPDTIMQQYDLTSLIHNKHIYIKIHKGMYGLGSPKLAALPMTISLNSLPHMGLLQCLWKRTSYDLTFTLVVDNFGVKYINKPNAQHLLNTLHESYVIREDWAGTKYCGLTLDWDYVNRICNVSMPGYIKRALQHFQHPMPIRKQHSPHAWQNPQYGAKTQFSPSPEADYFTKHHSASHHQQVRSSYLHEPSDRSHNYFDCLHDSNIPCDSPADYPPPGSAPLSDAICGPWSKQ